MNLSALIVELEVWSPVETLFATRGTIAREGDVIARPSIADPKVYQFPNDGLRAGGTVVATEGRFVKIVGFVDNLVSFAKNTKNLTKTQI